MLQLIDELSIDHRNYIIEEEGRDINERAFVLIEKGVYQGFGYITEKEMVTSLTAYKSKIIKQKDNRDVQRIISGFRKKNEHCLQEIQ